MCLIWVACSEEEGLVFWPTTGWDRETKLWSALLCSIAPLSDKIVKHIALNDRGIRSKDSMGVTPAAIMSAVAGSGTSSGWAAPCMPTCAALWWLLFSRDTRLLLSRTSCCSTCAVDRLLGSMDTSCTVHKESPGPAHQLQRIPLLSVRRLLLPCHGRV